MDSDKEDGQLLIQRLHELADKANLGDRQAVFDLRTMLVEDRRLVEDLGDLNRNLEVVLLHKFAPDEALTQLAVSEKLSQLRTSLAGTNPTEIERLLIGNVCVNYLAYSLAVRQEQEAATGNSPRLLAQRSKRAESMQRRYLASIKMLTTLRAFAPAGLVPAEPGKPAPLPKLLA